MSKLWLDDVQPAPDDSWDWCKTVDAALDFVAYHECSEWSLDHDLGGQQAHYGRGDYDYSVPTGLDFLNSLVESIFPPKITIHSTNRYGANQMAEVLRTFHDVKLGYTQVVVDPTIGRMMDMNPYYEKD